MWSEKGSTGHKNRHEKIDILGPRHLEVRYLAPSKVNLALFLESTCLTNHKNRVIFKTGVQNEVYLPDKNCWVEIAVHQSSGSFMHASCSVGGRIYLLTENYTCVKWLDADR